MRGEQDRDVEVLVLEALRLAAGNGTDGPESQMRRDQGGDGTTHAPTGGAP